MRDGDGRLLRTFNHGQARLTAYLEDHAFLLEALLTLYESSFDERFFSWARPLADEILARFADPERGGFFVTAADGEPLIVRRKDLEDHPMPSGSSSAALGLLRLAALSGESAYEEAALGAIALAARDRAALPRGVRAPAVRDRSAHRRRARGGDRRAGELGRCSTVRARAPPPPHRARLRRAHRWRRAVRCCARARRSTAAPRAYVCEHFACQAPVSDPQALRALLG